jgi:hypothetical protein
MLRHGDQIEVVGAARPHQLNQAKPRILALQPAADRGGAPPGADHEIRPGRLQNVPAGRIQPGEIGRQKPIGQLGDRSVVDRLHQKGFV